MTLMGAIKQLHELRSAEDIPFYYKPVIAEVINVLLMDTQEVRHGHWIKDDTGAEYCSNCHEYPYDDGEYHITNWHSNYCPHCGARMDEVEDDD